ncbi:MAG: class I SAM-dependent methyltransferase [Bacteroidia bacterium]|nr:class I SAM-dependent methyltransferase [Bacteroidia bacterium]MBT8277513.1 class I SAM-dependent methyltransferase [Bacteroidia bacterium]NND25432.1 class I SAM-dependent methyltransferase [Flavobacteriaceae bacterium]NNK60602.1 class I SAM-dependent methyltransferase [Flavobacteriaceae bacterium]RZW46043.1 MAG: class I SAM-dependent methyltransferase [Flavobacteriaceae bacterium]
MQFSKFLILVLCLPVLCFSQYQADEWKERDSWMPLKRLFEVADIKSGIQIADIGCHEGYLTVHLAKRVGQKGQVYAVDVRKDRLEVLKNNLKERNLSNVTVILGDYDDPKLPDGQLDVVIIMDTYHEMTDYKIMLERVYKALKPGGKLIIFEKLKKRVKNGTRDEQTEAHTIASKYVKKELEAANFTITKELYDLGDWTNDPEKPMWLVVGEKAGDTKMKSSKF